MWFPPDPPGVSHHPAMADADESEFGDLDDDAGEGGLFDV